MSIVKQFTISGSLILNGQASGTRITLDSSDSTNRFAFDVSGSDQNVSFVDVSNSESSTNDIIAVSSLDTTNTDSGDLPATAQWIFFNTITISGTSNLADSTTVRWAQNATLRSHTNMVLNGSFLITIDPTLIAEDIVTVWADGVADNLEATTVTEYDGTGNITSMLLQTGTFAIGSDDTGIHITMTELGQYDNANDEDIIYLLSAGNTLQSAQVAMGFLINTGSFVTDGYEMDIAGTIQVSGTLDATSGAGGNTIIDAGGAWIVSGGVFSSTNSTVLFTGTTSTQTFDILPSSYSFYNVGFNDNGGGTTWELEGTMGVD